MKISGKAALVACVWLAVAIQLLINQDLKRSGYVVEAFSNTEAIPVEACVSVCGKFGDMELSADTKSTMLCNVVILC